MGKVEQVYGWMLERTEEGSPLGPEERIRLRKLPHTPTEELYLDYKTFCEERSLFPAPYQSFGTMLTKLGHYSMTMRRKGGYVRSRSLHLKNFTS